MARFSSLLKAKTSFVIKRLSRSESRSLGYAHWRNLRPKQRPHRRQSRSLGYAHWPELYASRIAINSQQSRSLGYAHWPEPPSFPAHAQSLDHWDMRTGRNRAKQPPSGILSLDHWDMHWPELNIHQLQSRSLGYAHWPEQKVQRHPDAIKQRSLGICALAGTPPPIGIKESRSLGYAHWPERDAFNLWIFSLDHWDMRTGRNRRCLSTVCKVQITGICTGRNQQISSQALASSLDPGICALAGTQGGPAHRLPSLDHWDMRTGRNLARIGSQIRV